MAPASRRRRGVEPACIAGRTYTDVGLSETQRNTWYERKNRSYTRLEVTRRTCNGLPRTVLCAMSTTNCFGGTLPTMLLQQLLKCKRTRGVSGESHVVKEALCEYQKETPEWVLWTATCREKEKWCRTATSVYG